MTGLVDEGAEPFRIPKRTDSYPITSALWPSGNPAGLDKHPKGHCFSSLAAGLDRYSKPRKSIKTADSYLRCLVTDGMEELCYTPTEMKTSSFHILKSFTVAQF